ncbi:hypothetical protein TWF694_007260 [Orbilia ellipsospora]|uniref:F-box domain-containing protein n=1 Tax=Orbilia ellipsospora TaxID=2528407 RepID=A0AAV9XH68_9PEZI
MDSQRNHKAVEEESQIPLPSSILYDVVEYQDIRDDAALLMVGKPARSTESDQYTIKGTTKSKENIPILRRSPEPPEAQSKEMMDLDGLNDVQDASLTKPRVLLNSPDILMNEGLTIEHNLDSTFIKGTSKVPRDNVDDNCEKRAILAADENKVETESTDSDDTDGIDNKLERTGDRSDPSLPKDLPKQPPCEYSKDGIAELPPCPPYYSDSDTGTSSTRYDSPIPLPDILSRRILEYLSESDLRNFAATSKTSYITALPILARCVILPLPEAENDINTALATDISHYVRTAIIDLSDPVFYVTNFPGDVKTRQTLHNFQHLKHLIIRKSTVFASDAILGSLLLYLVEQNNLEELTLDLDCNTKDRSIDDFGQKFYRSWKHIHAGAFHNFVRSLTKLNFVIKNRGISNDGLCAIENRDFWRLLMISMRSLKIDVRTTPYSGSGWYPNISCYLDYIKLVGASTIQHLDITFDKAVQKPYVDINTFFPRVKTLKVTIVGFTTDRNAIEVNSVGRLKFLTSVDLPWAYETATYHETSLLGIYSKAKEKAKEVVHAKSPAEVKDNRLKTCMMKQTRHLTCVHRLGYLQDVKWRYMLEPNEEERVVKFAIEWINGTACIREVEVGGCGE